MGVSDENMGDGFSAHRIEKGGDMRLVERTGIDDRDLTAADDIGHGPLEREWSGIIGEQPPHTRHHLVHRFGGQVEAPVKRDFGAHTKRPQRL